MAIDLKKVDREAQELALTHWEEFKKVFGIDLTQYTICKHRNEGKSIRQIAVATRLDKDKVHRMCRICP